MSKVIGRKIIHENICKFENGVWNSTSKIIESRLIEGEEEWEDASIEAFAMDKLFENSYGIALNTVLEEFIKRTVQRGFDSLLTANDYDRSKLLQKVDSDEREDKSN